MQSSMLMSHPNGMRYRGTLRQPRLSQQQPRSRWVNNTAVRANLFRNKQINSVEYMKQANRARSQAQQEALLHEMALEQAIASERASHTGDLLLSGQGVIQSATKDLLKDTRELKIVTRETLTVSKRIETGVKDIKAMLRTPGGAGSLMMNPFFSLITFMIMHPFLPVTIESLMTLWSIVLSANYVKQVSTTIARGESLISLEGGLLGVVKNMVFSAPHAIVLMYKLSSMWAQERTGTREYAATNAATFAATMEPSNWEPFIATQFIKGMETMRNFSMANATFRAPAIPTSTSISDLRVYLESVSTDAYREIQQLDPQLFEDKAGCIQLILEYAMGKLYVKAKGVAISTLNMPAYLYELRTVMSAEQWILQCLFHLMKDLFTKLFKESWESSVNYMCMAICVFAPPSQLQVVSGGGFGNWISSAKASVTMGLTNAYSTTTSAIASSVSTVTNKLAQGASAAKAYAMESALENMMHKLATWACDCSKYGPKKAKLDGGGGTRKQSKGRHSTRKSRVSYGTSHDHEQFILLSWRFVLYTLAPVFTGIPLLPTSPTLIALDSEMRELLLRKVETGQFRPPILLSHVGVEKYLA